MKYVTEVSYSGDPGENLHGFFGRAAAAVDGTMRALGAYGRVQLMSSVTAPARHGIRDVHGADYALLFEPADDAALKLASEYLAAGGFSKPQPYQPPEAEPARVWK